MAYTGGGKGGCPPPPSRTQSYHTFKSETEEHRTWIFVKQLKFSTGVEEILFLTINRPPIQLVVVKILNDFKFKFNVNDVTTSFGRL